MKQTLQQIWLSILIFAFGTIAFAGTAELNQVESRITSYLETYLNADEFMVIVTPKSSSATPVKEKSQPKSNLPGMPGLASDGSVDYRTYFDLDGRIHEGGSGSAFTVHVVISKAIDKDRLRIFKKMIPLIARIDKTRGDEIRITSGTLDRSEPQNQTRNSIDSIVQHKRELSSLGLGLLAAIAFIIGLHGLFNYLTADKQNKKPKHEAVGEVKPDGAPAANSEGASKGSASDAGLPTAAPQALSRKHLYSKDSAIFDLIKEIGQEAKNHPDRIARLLTEWIQRGESGIRSAAMLLHNFELKVQEGVLAKMVPSDLDYLQPHVDINFDPFAEQNVLVIFNARQSLMKITAQSLREGDVSHDLAFMAQLEDEVLLEILRNEPSDILALACTQVPAHRVATVAKTLSPEKQTAFFVSLCRLDKIDNSARKEIAARLKRKLESSHLLAFTQTAKINAVANLLNHIPSPTRQEAILEAIKEVSPEVNSGVRDRILLFDDVVHLPDRILKILLLEADPVVVSVAFRESAQNLKDRITFNLPKASAEIFTFEVSELRNHSYDEVEKAKFKMVDLLQKLAAAKVVDFNEIKLARNTGSPVLKVVGEKAS
ncbi:MAG: FliG C-terminal domain-containing protein [Bdellovibrionia bacterium]